MFFDSDSCKFAICFTLFKSLVPNDIEAADWRLYTKKGLYHAILKPFIVKNIHVYDNI